MAEIGAERRQMMRDGLTVVGAGLERADGKGVPQVVKARTWCSVRFPQSELAGQLHEDDVGGDLVGRPNRSSPSPPIRFRIAIYSFNACRVVAWIGSRRCSAAIGMSGARQPG